MADKLMAWSQGDPASIVGDYIHKWELEIRREHLIMSGCRDHEAFNGEIDGDSRKEVTKWMRGVSYNHGFQCKTFHMGVNFLDAYMTYYSGQVRLEDFQLLAIFCLFTAAKIEETDFSTKLSHFVKFALEDLTTDADRAQMLSKIKYLYKCFQHELLNMFDWNMLIPSAIDYLLGCFERHRMLTACKSRVEFAHFDMDGYQYDNTGFFSQAASLLHHAVCEVESLKFSNSQLASSAFYRTVMTHESVSEVPFYPADVELVTGFTLAELEECLEFMSRFNIS
ncbi:hypothetical protein BC831DRAFT_503104 [Entophlyctis helioformis]|nr:hypothetical protein BC831DRAFT_503104 [Entophlyctis helioformis]